MYQGQLYDYDGDGTPEAPYKDAGSGPYTHYVDRSDPNCTDGNGGSNFGTPALPRCTIPGPESAPLKAGSVVEIHGRYDYDHTSPADLHAEGTAERPVFYRGASPASRPTITGAMGLVGSTYTIVENLIFADRDGDLSDGPVGSFGVSDKNGLRYDSHHIALRHSDLSGNRGRCSGTGTGVYGVVPVSEFSNVVFWDNKVHDLGDYLADFDQDCHGFTIAAGAHHVWVVDNEMARNSGDGIQINGGNSGQAYTHHIYVGRNVSHQNKQCGFWTKSAADVIFSQNTAYDHRFLGSSTGCGLGYQYEPDRVWFLFNHAYHDRFGIFGASTVNLTATDAYFVGNVIHDTLVDGPFDPGDSFGPAGGHAFNVRGAVNRFFVNNTIYNTYGGIVCYYSGATCHLENNVISGMNGGGPHVLVDVAADASSMKNNLLYQPDRPPTISWGGYLYPGVASFQTYTGKGQGSLQADPRFVNAAAGDFHLLPDSPAKDAGLASAVYATFTALYGVDLARDIDGQPRPEGAAWDIGADEGGPIDSIPPTVSITAPAEGGRVSADVDVVVEAADNVFLSRVEFTVSPANPLLAEALVLAPHEPAWDLGGVGDVNGDGHNDLFWRHRTSDANAVWLLNGLHHTGSVLLEALPPSWSAGGVGDFNGDGKTDILWRQAATGANRLWLMDGAVRVDSVDLAALAPPWTVAGVGDFDGDHKPDILWREANKGSVKIWFMNGTAIHTETDYGAVDPVWLLAGVGDFNADGKPDLLWRHRLLGVDAVWLLDGLSVMRVAPLPTISDPSWRIENCGDLNGDGVAEVIWQNEGAGPAAGWGLVFRMQGPARLGDVSVAPYRVRWETAGFANGTYELTARAVDWAGNVAVHKVTVTLDKSAAPARTSSASSFYEAVTEMSSKK